jgi:hypothetical protein
MPLSRRLQIIILIVTTLLMIPLIAKLFTDEVNWSLFDFIVAGIILLGTGFAVELIMRKVTKLSIRITLCVLLLVTLLLVWIELAVGLFGTPFAGN